MKKEYFCVVAAVKENSIDVLNTRFVVVLKPAGVGETNAKEESPRLIFKSVGLYPVSLKNSRSKVTTSPAVIVGSIIADVKSTLY